MLGLWRADSTRDGEDAPEGRLQGAVLVLGRAFRACSWPRQAPSALVVLPTLDAPMQQKPTGLKVGVDADDLVICICLFNRYLQQSEFRVVSNRQLPGDRTARRRDPSLPLRVTHCAGSALSELRTL